MTRSTAPTAAIDDASSTSAATAKPKSRALAEAEKYALVGVLVLTFGAFSLALPHSFPTAGNVVTMLMSESVIVVLAIGVTLTLRLGDLDLSFASVMETAAVITADLNVNHHLGIAVSILIALVFGALVGLLNAILVVKLGLNSFIATLGTMTVVEGLGYGISTSTVITGTSQGFVNLISDEILGIPVAVWLGWLLAAVFWLIYEHTAFGRYLLFIGGNRSASTLLGLPTARVRLLAYVLSGITSSLAGMILLGTLTSADPTISPQYLLPPLAGVFLGTAAIQIGRFNIVGTMVGLYLLVTISTGLEFLGMASWVGEVFNGIALVAAIGLARLTRQSTATESALGFLG